ncbi:MAG TPA: hypothetical protein VIV40_27815 [Kofleriaceae bacterium]
MRAIWIAAFLLVASGCSSDVLDNTTYRRLVDQFDSYDQCPSEGNFAPCYQTLTFCADGRANANLEFRQEGDYHVRDTRAIALLPNVTVIFDLETASSAQLPGRHPWELVDPLIKDCATH